MRPRFIVHMLLATVGLSYGAAELRAVAFNVSPSADSFVSANNPNNNYGGGGGIAVSAAGLPKGELQSLLRFDLAAAKASFDTTFGVGNWTLDSASLQLTATGPGNPVFNTSAAGQIAASWMQNDSWVEGTGTPNLPGATGITWTTLPTFLSGSDQSLGAFAFSGATSGTAIYVLNATSGLKSDTLTGGLASIRLLAGDSAVSGVFNSRQFTTVASRPVLILDAVQVPEPTSSVLAVFGLLSIALFLLVIQNVAANWVNKHVQFHYAAIPRIR